MRQKRRQAFNAGQVSEIEILIWLISKIQGWDDIVPADETL
jgi:hypothetical protein